MKLIDSMYSEEIAEVIERYTVSWYSDIDRIPAERCSPRPKDEHIKGRELVKAMWENVQEAIDNRDGIKARYERAQREGLFDIKRAEDVSHELREKWLAAVEVMKGDKVRCISELKHWREYLAWAMEEERKASPDPRLPAEAAE